MMAVTIRNTEEHEKMLDNLKRQTGKTTVSKALIQGGYDALHYRKSYESEKASREQAEQELRALKRKVQQYFTSKADLESVISG